MNYGIGLSGLTTTSQSLDVISQNIANVSTAGYKAASSEFAALYSGGNGSGVEVASVDQDFDTDGTQQATGNALDMAISGNGFFVLTTPQGQNVYTRAGNFSQDANNNIVNNAGYALQGYPVDDDGNLLTGGTTNLQISTANVPARASTSLTFDANLKADSTVIDTSDAGYTFDPNDASTYSYSYSSSVYDSLGQEHQVTQYFVNQGNNNWNVNYYVDGAANNSATLQFDNDGVLAAVNGDQNANGQVPLTITPDNAAAMDLNIDYRNDTQYAADFSASYDTDGYGSGELSDIAVDDDGSIFAIYSNGTRLLQGQVALANFANPNGLQQADNTSWSATTDSGTAQIGSAGSGVMGTLSSGSYEGSNVDLSSELVDLMTAQRNYQANARTISSNDQMMQVLFNTMS